MAAAARFKPKDGRFLAVVILLIVLLLIYLIAIHWWFVAPQLQFRADMAGSARSATAFPPGGGAEARDRAAPRRDP